eukprot:3582127-Prymnesium_polylepis.1
MSFSFNFGASAESAAAARAVHVPALRAASEHTITELHPDADAWPIEDVPVPDDCKSRALRKRTLPESQLATLLEADAPSEVPPAAGNMSNSDLLSNVYEGGFKLWECARDLLQVVSECVARGELELTGAAVLEAGCGAGLPGMLAMQLGASRLVLQDFNPGVLRAMTMPALQLNGLWARAQAADVRFLGGDWSCVSDMLLRESARSS